MTVQRAFENAVQRLGQAAALECEFEKIGETGEARARAFTSFIKAIRPRAASASSTATFSASRAR